MGRPEGLKIRQDGRTIRSPIGRSVQKNERPIINFFGPPPTEALASGTSCLWVVSSIGRPGPKRCFLLRPHDSGRGPIGSLRIALLRLARPRPTGGIRPGMPARKGPGANGERSALSQTTIPGPYPTPAKTVLHDCPDISSIVGADICVYSICRRRWTPVRQKAPHMPLGIGSGH